MDSNEDSTAPSKPVNLPGGFAAASPSTPGTSGPAAAISAQPASTCGLSSLSCLTDLFDSATALSLSRAAKNGHTTDDHGSPDQEFVGGGYGVGNRNRFGGDAAGGSGRWSKSGYDRGGPSHGAARRGRGGRVGDFREERGSRSGGDFRRSPANRNSPGQFSGNYGNGPRSTVTSGASENVASYKAPSPPLSPPGPQPTGPAAKSTPGAASTGSGNGGEPWTVYSSAARPGAALGSLTSTPATETPSPCKDSAPKGSDGAAAGATTDAVSGTAPVAATPQPWRPRRCVGNPREKLHRDIKSLLNKLTVENFHNVGEQLAQNIESIDNVDVLAEAVQLVLEQSLLEPDFSELYADLFLILIFRGPQSLGVSSSSAPAKQSQMPVAQIAIQKWREVFEGLPEALNKSKAAAASMTPEDAEVEASKLRTRIRSTFIILGEFLIRHTVGLQSFNIATTMVLNKPDPSEVLIEGICALLTTAGFFLDSDPKGKLLLENCFGRLRELDSYGRFSKRISCMIQDLIDARQVKWVKKIHKVKPKGLSQIKQEIEDADLVGGSIVRAQYGVVAQLGSRSNLLKAEYAAYLANQEQHYKSRLKALRAAELQ